MPEPITYTWYRPSVVLDWTADLAEFKAAADAVRGAHREVIEELARRADRSLLLHFWIAYGTRR